MKTGKIFIILAILLAFWTLAAEAGPKALILHEKDRGRTINLQVGQKLILNLRNPASGGYGVNRPTFNAAILKLLEQKTLAPKKQMPGNFGQLYYEWQALAKGQTEISIYIKRPWEKKLPEEYWRVKVLVQ